MAEVVVKWSRIRIDGVVSVACALPVDRIFVDLNQVIIRETGKGAVRPSAFSGVIIFSEEMWPKYRAAIEFDRNHPARMERDADLGRVVVRYADVKKGRETCRACQFAAAISQAPECPKHQMPEWPPKPPKQSGARFSSFEDFVGAVNTAGARGRRGFSGVDPSGFSFSVEFVNAFPAAPRPAPPPPRALRGNLPTSDDYRVLGLQHASSEDEVKRAHRALAVANHPDRGGSNEKLAAINVARDRILFAIENGVG